MALKLQRFAAKICGCFDFNKCRFEVSSLVACSGSPASMHQMSKSYFGKASAKATGGLQFAMLRRLLPPLRLCVKSRFAVMTNVSMAIQVNTRPVCFSSWLKVGAINPWITAFWLALLIIPNCQQSSQFTLRCSRKSRVYFLTTGLQLGLMTQNLATLYLVNLNQRRRCSPAKRSLLSDSDNNEGTVHMSPSFLLHFNASLNI